MYPLDACVFSCASVNLKFFQHFGRDIEEQFKRIQGIMASLGNGARQFSSSTLVRRGVATIPAGDGNGGSGSGTRHALNMEMTENKAALAEERWERVVLQYWTCKTTKKYVKMYHIDKLFPSAVWSYNHNVSGVKPSESTLEHFKHRVLEVWSTLYSERTFGPKNKNIISYSLTTILYVELVLKRKVDWRMVFTRNLEEIYPTALALLQQTMRRELCWLYMYAIQGLLEEMEQHMTKTLGSE
jgi:hypothetical protein